MHEETHLPPVALARIITMALMVQLVFALLSMSPAVYAPVAAPSMGIGAEWVGLLFAASAITGMLAGIASTAIFTRFGIVRSLQFGCLAMSLAMLLGATGLPWLALGAGLLFGLALGPAAPACTYLLVQAVPRHQLGVYTSIQQVGPPLGIALGGALIPALILLAGWRLSLIWLSLAALAIAALLQPLRTRVDRHAQPNASLGWQAIVKPLALVGRTPGLRKLAAAALAFAIVHQGQVAFLVIYLTLERQMDLVTAGLAMTGSQVAAMVGRLFWGWLADRTQRPFRVMSAVAFMACALFVSVALFPEAGSRAALISLAILLGAGAAGWQGTLYATAARLAPTDKVVSAIGGVQFFMFIGGAAGPLLVSTAVSVSGHYWIAYCGVATLALALATSLWHIQRGRPRGDHLA